MIKYLGTVYGGWAVDLSKIKDGDLIIDAGLGEDISFLEELLKEKKVNIIGIDPTVKSHAFVEKKNLPELKLLKKAIAKDGVKTIRMFKNSNPEYVSESTFKEHQMTSDDSYEVECVSFKELIDQHQKIAVIKMDIEGVEYEVLEECLGIPQLCVEFHHHCINGIEFKETRNKIKLLLNNGYKIIHKNDKLSEISFSL